MRKITQQTQVEERYTKYLLFLKLVKVTKNQESLRDCHSPEEPKEMWQVSVVWCSEWDPGTGKGAGEKLKKSE